MIPTWLSRVLLGALVLSACMPAQAEHRAPAISATDSIDKPQGAFYFADDFERKDAPQLGSPWTDCQQQTPSSYEPLGIYEGGVVVTKPKSRPGEYASTPASKEDIEAKKMVPGIGCAWVDTGAASVSVKIVWSGNHGVDHPPPISHVEGTPLLYISPQHPRYGFGAWISEVWGQSLIFAGYIASPPENFEVIASAIIPEHTSGENRELEIRSQPGGTATIWLDGEQVSFREGFGLNPLPIDPTMLGSTRHGFAVDAHFVDPVENIPKLKSIESISITEILPSTPPKQGINPATPPAQR